MKAVLAALLLLFQVQPLLGAVVCLGSAKQSAEQCQMPEHGKMMGASASESGESSAGQNCAGAVVCRTAPPAIPSLVGAVQSQLPLLYRPAIAGAPRLLGIPPAPPFHPPKA